MNKRRLLKLADLLEADAKNKKGIQFDLGVLGQSSYHERDFEAAIDCGTTACAMGLAAISGAFKHAGLSYKIDGAQIDTTMNGRRTSYDRAAARIFEISIREADFLFTPLFYSAHGGIPRGAEGERFVANRIRAFVAGKAVPHPTDVF